MLSNWNFQFSFDLLCLQILYFKLFMRGNPTPELFDLIAAKFIVNLPKEQLESERLGFHFQKAYFYYLDTQGLKTLYGKGDKPKQINNFCNELLRVVSCPQLPKITGAQIAQSIQENYCTVPVDGIIILNIQETHALLVESQDNCKFGFPKGKISEGQSAEHCASRQVKQQIGIKLQVDSNFYVEVEVNSKIGNKSLSKPCRFYICKVQETCIVPRKCKNQLSNDTGLRQIIHSAAEIKSIGWFKLQDQIAKMNLNTASKLAYYELLKKIGKNNKSLVYKQKKKLNPLQEFKGFDPKLGNIFLR